MKKSAFFVLFSMVVATACNSQPPASPRIKAESSNVTVAYGQPSKKDRKIFGALIPFGEIWRTGANEATEITFKKDGMFGGTALKAGTYSLFTIPGEKEWTVVLNPTLKQWGSYDYDKIKDKDVLKITVPGQATKEPVEKLTFAVSDDKLDFMWDTAMFSVPSKF
ncbi:MAG: DUF2911 domain-containing protein [Runella slithyformis]|nr:MAG: DUF2911 domain-containing protein [Runella slithyformis]